jgi:hypothetical protein
MTLVEDVVRGDETGLAMPTHPEALRAMGVDFLTDAFRAFGVIAPDNRVTRITRWEPCAQGSTGQKLFLSVDCLRPEPGFDRDLFVKFSRDFTDPVRDRRGKFEMAAEVRLGALSRMPGFPIAVPRVCFADYHGASHSGLLITHCIPFGTGAIEPHHEKCMDHRLADPLAHYRAIVRALARVAAAHRAGRLADEVERRFPYDPAAVRLPHDADELATHIAAMAAFAEECPQLLPPALRAPSLYAGLAAGATGYLAAQDAIGRFLQADRDMIALCHWNANIDNAWFWRDAAGDLQCGLMDWGHVGQMNLAFAIWGSLSSAGIDLWDDHGDELIALFLDELAAQGGPRIDRARFELHLYSYIALMGLSYFVESPARMRQRLPGMVHAAGPRDPLIEDCSTVRNQLHMMALFLHLWATRDLAGLPARIAG